MASDGVFNGSFGGHWLAYFIYTNTYFFIFFFGSRSTDLHFHLPIGKEARVFSSGYYEEDNFTDKLSFLFFASGGFSVWKGGMVTRVRPSSLFCSCLHRRPFFFKGK